MKMRSGSARKLLSFLILFLVICSCSSAARNERFFSDKGEFGAVSTGHPLATKAAAKVLENGGNAIDAAVCAAFMLGVVDFTNSGIGGDGYALVHLPGGSIVAFDGSCKRPENKVPNPNEIGLPTAPDLLLKLLNKFGSRSRAEVMAPAIKTSIQGFKVSSYLHQVIRKRLLKLTDPQAIKLLAPEGYAIPAGSILKLPDLSRTLMQIARDNGRSFYSGEDAKTMVNHLNKLGSSYGLQDFSNFRSHILKPIKYDWKNYALYGAPPPSSSVAAILFARKLLENQICLFPENAAELLKIARLGKKVIDFKYNHLSNFVGNPDGFLNAFTEIPEKNATMDSEDDSHTTHLCVWDRQGMAVSMTLTLGSHCGTGDLSPLGFFYNNEMRNFKPAVANYGADYPQNEGPISSKAPIMLKKDGKLFSILGGAGSDRIIFNVGLVAARLISDASKLSEAVNSPRFFLDYKNVLQLEWTPDKEITSQLQSSVKTMNLRESGEDFFGLVTAICKNSDSFNAVSDFRRDGACQTIKRNPQRERVFNLKLNVSCKKKLKSLQVAGPINDSVQQATEWRCSNASGSKVIADYTNFSFASALYSVDLAQKIKVTPGECSVDSLRNEAIKGFCNLGNGNEKIQKFAQAYQNLKTVKDLVQSLMIDIGFEIPYKRVRKKTSAEMLLDAGFGDCSGKARLMIKVLKSYGVTARLVGGLICSKKMKTSTHLWVEVMSNDQWIPVCPVNQYFGHIPSNWVKFRYGENQTIEPGGKLTFSIREKE